MNDQTIKAVVDEIAPSLVGCLIGKVYQLSRFSVAIDFRKRDSQYLVLGVDPQPGPRLYLLKRRLRDIEKQSLPPGAFVMTLTKQLTGARLVAIEKDVDDRIVSLKFASTDVTGRALSHTIIAQLTGRTASLLLLDGEGYVIDSLRPSRNPHLESAHKYERPTPSNKYSSTGPDLQLDSFASVSEAADAYYQRLESERSFTARITAARTRLKREIDRRIKLRRHLNADLEGHGDAAEHKRVGELLLANIGTASRQGEVVTVTDYYSEGTPQIVLRVDENVTLQEAAANRFARYTKARRAAVEIERRLDEIEGELQSLMARLDKLERINAAHDETSFADTFGEQDSQAPARRTGKADPKSVPGTRRYLSSDGFDILVGRQARDNDHLTFRIARPYDLWLHAADYPGSHVIVVNPSRKEIPHRTVVEAAQLAAKFSKARHDGKVDVHYTQRKFLAKPKGAAPGLVRMSSFRTIIVEPLEGVKRI